MKNKTKILILILVMSLIFLNIAHSVDIPFAVRMVLIVGFGFYFLMVLIASHSRSFVYNHEIQQKNDNLGIKFFREFFISVLFIGWSLNGLARENILNLKTIFFYCLICSACLSVGELLREVALFIGGK